MTTILLVEDDRVMRDLTRLALARAYPQATLLTAHDGDEALEYLRTHQLDLVLLDILLPRRNGLEVMRAMQALRAVPVIVISALGVREVVQQAVQAGARDFVLKPFDPRLLVDKVQRVLAAQGAYADAG